MNKLRDTVLLLDCEGLVQSLCKPFLQEYPVDVVSLDKRHELTTIMSSRLRVLVKVIVLDISIYDRGKRMTLPETFTFEVVRQVMTTSTKTCLVFCCDSQIWSMCQSTYRRMCQVFHGRRFHCSQCNDVRTFYLNTIKDEETNWFCASCMVAVQNMYTKDELEATSCPKCHWVPKRNLSVTSDQIKAIIKPFLAGYAIPPGLIM